MYSFSETTLLLPVRPCLPLTVFAIALASKRSVQNFKAFAAIIIERYAGF